MPDRPPDEVIKRYRVPEKSDFYWATTPPPVVHKKLTLRGVADGSLDAEVLEISRDYSAGTYEAVVAKATALAAVASQAGGEKSLPLPHIPSGITELALAKSRLRNIITPFDIKVPQCWLVIELAGSWEFSRTTYPLLAKHQDPEHVSGRTGHNFGLRNVYANGVADFPRSNEACRFVLMGVAHRTGKNSIPPALGSHLFDLNVRLLFQGGKYWDIAGDPDVGNEGPDEFP